MGTKSGKLQIWRDYGCISLSDPPKHNGAILTISCNNLFILTGGADGKICILSTNYQDIRKVDMIEALPKAMETDNEVKAVASHNGGAGFVLMLRSGEIVEVVCDDSRIKSTSGFQFTKLRSSHYNLQKNKVGFFFSGLSVKFRFQNSLGWRYCISLVGLLPAVKMAR